MKELLKKMKREPSSFSSMVDKVGGALSSPGGMYSIGLATGGLGGYALSHHIRDENSEEYQKTIDDLIDSNTQVRDGKGDYVRSRDEIIANEDPDYLYHSEDDDEKATEDKEDKNLKRFLGRALKEKKDKI